MIVPGTAWLEWKIESAEDGSTLIQRARFVPRGLLGRLYWWSLLPFHAPIFRRMAQRIAATAEQRAMIRQQLHENLQEWLREQRAHVRELHEQAREIQDNVPGLRDAAGDIPLSGLTARWCQTDPWADIL